MLQIFRVSLIALLLMTPGCANISDPSSAKIDNLVIAEPLISNYGSERKIDRYTQIIFREDITKEQRAQLYYERGVLFDSVGLRSLAHVDFTRALQLKPDLVDVYNFIGIHYTQLLQFNEAYEAFDSAIELLPTHDYAYLNRGISLYYGNRPNLAVDDLTLFYKMKTQDPYRLLWLYLAQLKQDKEAAHQSLVQKSMLIDDNLWARQIIDLFIGTLSESDFINQLEIGIETKKQLSERLCEAYFYLGKYNQLLGHEARAASFFKLALMTNVYEFVEHRYAKLELDMMKI